MQLNFKHTKYNNEMNYCQSFKERICSVKGPKFILNHLINLIYFYI